MRNIFFWRGIEDAAFKQTDSGLVFYPYGALAAGYVVTAEQRTALAGLLRQFYLLGTIAIVIQIVLGPIFGFLIALAVVVPLLALLFVYLHVGIRARIGNAPRAGQRLGFGEAQRHAVGTMSNGRVTTILVLGALLLVSSLVMLVASIAGDNGEGMLLAGVSTLFFGLLFLVACYNAWLKWGRQA